MRISFVTLFPEMIPVAFGHSMLRRAVEAGHVRVDSANPRDFALDKHRTVDDSPCGGGPGMLMRVEPVHAALESLNLGSNRAIVMPDPTGARFSQSHAAQWSNVDELVFVCGHYEGIDDRIRQHWNAIPVSLGDFVLTGGELPALVMADAVVRLLPGVLGDPESLEIDSFSDGLLSAPQFTRPEEWMGMPVPAVLRSGDHGAVARYKRKESLRITRQQRPDLLRTANLSAQDLKLIAELDAE
jgi:tRNA (guanine37-N1)-methyltransferase